MARLPVPAETRFWAKVVGGDYTECWTWTGNVAPNGYGIFGIHSAEGVGAHRFAYEHIRGEIPAGLQLDHLCRNRTCVNPWHLDPVTPRVNLRRAPNNQANRTACPEGHDYTGENLYVHNGKRHCRTCRRETQRRYVLRKQQLAA